MKVAVYSEEVTQMSNYLNFFGFKQEPFPQKIKSKDIFRFPDLDMMKKRSFYTIQTGMVHVVTGAVGSGKTTSLEYICDSLHPSKYRLVPVTANTGSNLEILRQIVFSLDIECNTNSITKLITLIKQVILEIFRKNMVPVLIIDEAHLLREKILREIHTILTPEFRSEFTMPLILSGQMNLIDKMQFYTAQALASRVVGKTHFDGVRIEDTKAYILHHLKIAGIKENLFSDDAVIAIHQGSGGLFRKANNIARGALFAASINDSRLVSGEHVRMAETELF
jgi:type II secretory pathway predicted ATPase ExeA